MIQVFSLRKLLVIAVPILPLAVPAVFSTDATASVMSGSGSCTTGSYTESTLGGDSIGVFTAPNNANSSTGCTFEVPNGVTGVRVLVVGGGGGGGGYHTSGGGGAGGLLHEVGYEVTSGSALNVTVGRGGSPGSGVYNTLVNPGGDGSNSVFGSLEAIGGGGGGGGGTNFQVGNAGRAGGSGGGGGRCWTNCNGSLDTPNQNFRAGGAGTTGQGHAGGKTHFMPAAGGGGAGEPGEDAGPAKAAGAGGDGLQIDITGAATWYAGGGAGATELNTARTPGGLGGGGAGATGTTSPTWLVNGLDGTAHTGGGGGGTNWADGGGAGHGGSGIVVVRWSNNAPSTPSFTLTQSSPWIEQNTSATGLYSVTNTGDPITRFAVSPALPSGVSLNTSTGEISGSPTALKSESTYTLTAYRVSASNGSISRSSRTFSLGVYTGTVPTTPTTTTTVATTTTTTITSTTTAPAVAAAPSAPIDTPAPVSQSAIATIAPGVTTTTVRTPMKSVAPAATTLTTLPALEDATTLQTATSPTPPTAEPGSAGVVVDGVESSATITRSDNRLNVSGGGVTATVSGVSPAGERISLDADGNLRLSDGDQIVVEASGFVSGEEIGVWMFSTPTQLGSLTADASGTISGRFALPVDVESGDHRLVLEGVNSDGSPIIVGLGIAVGEIESSSTLARLLIAVPVALAIIFGLVIPTTLRRRRRESALV